MEKDNTTLGAENAMKVFNGKNAAEDYMSMHSLAYSTPEMTLKRFAYWLAEIVDVDCTIAADKCPNEDGKHPRHRLPRLMLYVESKETPYTVSKEEVDETAFRPTGALTTFYESKELHPEMREAETAARFCFECGAKISREARFCPQCGREQEAAG